MNGGAMEPFLVSSESNNLIDKRKYSYLNGRRRCFLSKKYCLFTLILSTLLFITLYLYMNSVYYDSSTSSASSLPTHDLIPSTLISPDISSVEFKIPNNIVNYDSLRSDNFRFNLNGNDVIIFLHIQKTGGTTFGKHLVQDIDLDTPCACRKNRRKSSSSSNSNKKYYNHDNLPLNRVKRKLHCDCLRPGSSKTWLFSRYSTGWKCGLHADWTELVSCVDPYLRKVEGEANRRYFYITFLRDPVSRYLSEFRHVQRGATWKGSLHLCGGKKATLEELPICYEETENGDGDWSDVTLDEFIECSSNLANNRMTRMLADLSLVNCYNTSSMSKENRDKILLESAKRNLDSMAFFGLTEEQVISEYMFQETFNLNFKVKFQQYKKVQGEKTSENLSSTIIKKIEKLNHLDMKLYQYAKTIMQQRFQRIKDEDEDFEIHYSKFGQDLNKYDTVSNTLQTLATDENY